MTTPLLLGLLSLLPSPQDADWPCYMGPTRNANAPAVASDFQWGEDGPGVLWRREIGPGYGGAAIQGGEVILLDREAGEMDIVRVLDLATGEDLWDFAYPAPGRLQFPGSRTVPSVTEDRIVTVGGMGNVVALDREAQDVVWESHLGEIYGGEIPAFGWSGSPLVLEDRVILAVLGEEVGLVALDLETGEELWISEGIGRSHSTPALVTLGGQDQIVFLSTVNSASGQDEAAPMMISSFDPEDGTPLWQEELLLTRLPIPAPVQIDDEHLFLTGGYRGGSTLLRVTQEEGETSVEELFHVDRGAQVHAPVLHDGHLYLIVNENWNDPRPRRGEGGLMCLDLEGNELWRTGAEPFFGRGNLLLAGDHLLIQDGLDGTLVVAKADPAGYAEVARAPMFDVAPGRDHQMWAPMAISGKRLVLRSQEELVCVEL